MSPARQQDDGTPSRILATAEALEDISRSDRECSDEIHGGRIQECTSPGRWSGDQQDAVDIAVPSLEVQASDQ